MTTDKQQEHEEGMRSSLKDVVAFIEKFAPLCASVEDLHLLAQKGLESDAVLRLLVKEVVPPPKR